MKFSEMLRRMVWPRRCLLCWEVVSFDDEVPFCEECIEDWKNFLQVKCRKCGRGRNECTCLPKNIKKINHSMAAWCVFYDASTNGRVNHVFTLLKRRYVREVINLCTNMMSQRVIQLFKSRGMDYKDYVVTYTPRKRRSVIKYGVDHAKKLAISLGKKLGLKVITTFKNRGKKEQKGLNKEQRLENAMKSYEYIEGSLDGYENVLLVDDIMTSGATIFSCAFQLYKNGAKNVIPVTFAKDNYRERGERTHAKRNTKYYITKIIKSAFRDGP